MTNYKQLADKLIQRRTHARHEQATAAAREMDAAQVYERIKLLVGNEIAKANTELRRRKLATVERVFMPCCQGRLCLTYGLDLFCTVDVQEGKSQITAVISGPPNATEISRKAFKMDGDVNPEEITAEIVSGLLMGEFA